MKIITLLILVILSGKLLAQDLTGYVFDNETKKPVSNVTISSGSRITSTAESGAFSLKNLKTGDVIQVSHISYQTYYLVKGAESTVTVFIKENSTALTSVVITSRGSYKQDSIRTRNDYAFVFNYKAPTLKDIFITKSDYSKPANTGNSFNSLISVNLLQVAALISKNKAPISKLRKTLLQEEDDNYVERRFSKEKVLSVTSLTGDSLQNFIRLYKPSAGRLKQMNEYELIQYIKKGYSEFIQLPQRKADPFVVNE